MKYCILTKSKWTDKEDLYPVIYDSVIEANKKIQKMDHKNETHRVLQLVSFHVPVKFDSQDN